MAGSARALGLTLHSDDGVAQIVLVQRTG